MRLKGGGFAYGDRAVLAPFALDLRAGETVAILGPSGAGKSTLLKQVAGLLPGLETPVAGNVAWMAQQDLLLPWATIRENVLLGARLLGVEGVIENQDGVCHLVARRFVDHSRLLGALKTASRDFH